ncbi:syd-1 (predicted) [Pycnogonum litorale]
MPSLRPSSNRSETPEPSTAEAESPRRGARGGSHFLSGRSRASQNQQPDMVVQKDFRKVSGISSEIFNQIQAVENDHDATTAASLEAVEKRGEMLVRILDPRSMGRAAQDASRRFLSAPQDPKYMIQFIEIVKRPGQTLGLYIREGNGIDRSDGVFVSRIALESAIYHSRVLRVSDEILAVNLVDVTRMSLDDVVIIMSIPRRLVLTLRTSKVRGNAAASMKPIELKGPPVVIVKKEFLDDDDGGGNSNSENGRLASARSRGFDGEISTRPKRNGDAEPDQCLYYNSQPRPKFKHRPLPPPPLPQPLCPKQDTRSQTLPPSTSHNHNRTVTSATSSTSAANTWRQSKEAKTSHYYCKQSGDLTQERHQRSKPLHQKSSVVTDQPKAHPSFPKTLESLAEKVHTFYSGPRLLDSRGQPIPGSIHGSSSEKALNVLSRQDRITGTLPRTKERFASGRLLRVGSDQKISTSYSQTLRNTANFEKYGRNRFETVHRMGSGAMRRRGASSESYSDTEATGTTTTRPSILMRQRSSIDSFGRYPGLVRTQSQSQSQSRSNSLPRMRGTEYEHRSKERSGRQKYSVRFERDTYSLQDSQDESDGAVSAPEMPSWKSDRRHKGRGPHATSVFTAAEYKDWLKRTPSTSAIYEQLKRSREVLHQQRASRLTYSAECLLDEAKKEEDRLKLMRPYATRRQISRYMQSAGSSLPSGLSASTVARMQLSDVRHIPNPSPTKATDARRLGLLEIEPNDYVKYKGEKELATQLLSKGVKDGGISGLLLVNLLAGRGLKHAAVGRHEPYRDLYSVLECDRVHKARTVVRMGDQNFDWDETFELDLINNKELDFLVYSWDPQFRHKLCYRGSIDIGTLFDRTVFHQIALRMEPRGTIYLKLRFSNSLKAFQRTAATASKHPARRAALFGVNIETTVARENSSFNVPIIVKRCIDEIDRRGLDIIGLYRLCGSATKKKTLRDSFERNPRLVDLSPDNVPDINVITGVLKDYLRELPEPLFPKGLFQMLLEALTVCFPDDQEGNAKLMFSILDCLPKYNKSTLIMLMDHFKMVLMEKEKNKMTALSLATCFAPLLICQTDQDTPTLEAEQPIQVMKYLLEIWPNKPDNPKLDASGTVSLAPNIVETQEGSEEAE